MLQDRLSVHFGVAEGAKLFNSLSSYSSDYDVDIRGKERQIYPYKDKTLLTIKRKKNLFLVNRFEKSDVDIYIYIYIYMVCTVLLIQNILKLYVFYD